MINNIKKNYIKKVYWNGCKGWLYKDKDGELTYTEFYPYSKERKKPWFGFDL